MFQRSAQVAIGGCDEAHIHLDRARAAQSLKFAFLQDAQELDLYGRRYISNFIEKERAFIGQLELPRLARCGPGKSSLLVAKKLAFEQILRNRRAIDLHKRP